ILYIGSVSVGTTLSVGSSITATGIITSYTGTITGRSQAITGTSGIPQNTNISMWLYRSGVIWLFGD
ncbi:MAG: hypothetical protein ACKPKO_53660, partial [Candidatus Fonsibacter sp.]